jgi:hypothetical protein
MKKRLMVGLLAGGLFAAMLPGVASANGEPIAGCPLGGDRVPHPEDGGWALVETCKIIPEDVGNQLDQNGDGWICRRFVMGFLNKYDGGSIFAAKDNTHLGPKASWDLAEPPGCD